MNLSVVQILLAGSLSVFIGESSCVCSRVCVCVTAGGLKFLPSASRENPCCHLRIRIWFTGWLKVLWWIKRSLNQIWQNWGGTYDENIDISRSNTVTKGLQRLWSGLYGLEQKSRRAEKLINWNVDDFNEDNHWLVYIFHIYASKFNYAMWEIKSFAVIKAGKRQTVKDP